MSSTSLTRSASPGARHPDVSAPDNEVFYRMLVHNLPDTVAMLFDAEFRYLAVEGEGATKLGLKHLVGSRVGDADGALTARMAGILNENCAAVLAGQRREFDLPFAGRVLQVTAAPMYDTAGNVCGGVTAARDVTEHRQAIDRLQYMAQYDALTGLPNRTLFSDTLKAAALGARAGVPATLFMLDLDNFKSVNDSLGHEAGDELLRIIATRLRGAVRSSDIVARLSGDEFAIIVENATSAEAEHALHRALANVSQPVTLSAQEVFPSASIGAVLLGRDSAPSELLRCADIAMYAAKAAGGNTYRFFEPDMADRAHQRLRLAGKLHRALDRDEFVLRYQPQLDVQTGEVLSVEALMRWERAGELVAPGEFIPVAESTGLIVPLGAWALRQACWQAAQWQREGTPLRVAVNVSPVQLRHAGFADVVVAALAENRLPAALLELEITESVLGDEDTTGALTAIRALGVKLTIDDFGTGYSSLGRLKNFPLDVLKIDRSFISELTDSAGDQAIARAVIALGKALGMTVLAEGVEREAEYEFLRAEGCDMCSGWLFCAALEPDRVVAYARGRMTASPAQAA